MDIVERLRKRLPNAVNATQEGADEIERLRAIVENSHNSQRAAVAAEREACAQIAIEMSHTDDGEMHAIARELAAAIRARSKGE